MKQFQLRRRTNKRTGNDRKVIEATYVGISGWTVENDEILVAITIRGEKETFELCIPREKVDNVCDRLQEVKKKLDKWDEQALIVNLWLAEREG